MLNVKSTIFLLLFLQESINQILASNKDFIGAFFVWYFYFNFKKMPCERARKTKNQVGLALCGKTFIKEKLQHKCGILPHVNSWVRKINWNIYDYEVLRWLTCQFQVNVPLLNSLKISENQRLRFSDVFKG